MNNILRASAGTGKTYRLSLDYVGALLRGEAFEDILVMTFTRKATAEIRERVISHIEDILDLGEGSELFENLRDIYGDIELDLDLLRKSYERMLKNKDKIKIYTIDSFINNIFKRAIAPYLDIYGYKIVDNDKNREIIEGVFKSLLDNKRDFEVMEGFLKDNTERNVDKYIELIEKLVSQRWKFLLIEKAERSKKATGNLVGLFEEAIDILEEIAIDRGKELSPAFFKKDFKGYLKLARLEDKEGYIIKNYKIFIKDEFWNGGKTRAKAVAHLLEDLRANYELFRENLAHYIYNTEVIAYEESLFAFSNRVFDIYDGIKFKEKIFTHSDISNYTYKYFYKEDLNLLEGKEVSDYFLHLMGAEFKTLLIDEFQDTSILQWKILKPLIDRAQNLILVGDEKQSIYGWRGGEKDLFAKVDNILEGRSESLNTCYRSQKEIIEFINGFFNGIYEGWQYEGVKGLAQKGGGYLQVLLGGDSLLINPHTKAFQKLSGSKQEEALEFNSKLRLDLKREIAESIKENLSNYKSVGILARGNNDLEEIAIELDKLQIPYILESKKSLIEHRAIKPLYALLSYLVYNDYFQLLVFLRSDLVGLNNRGLKYLLRKKGDVEGYMLRKDGSIDSTDLIKVLDQVRGLKSMSYNSLSKHLIEGFGLLDIYRGNSGALKNIYRFFGLTKEFSHLKDFMDYIDQNKESEELKQVGVKESNAVRLMTIHKAKGLSFETEFFYWKPSSGRGNSGDELEIYLNFDDRFEGVERYLLTNSKYNSLLQYLSFDFHEKNQRKKFEEEINNIYVALTRPERNLFLYIEAPCKFKKKGDNHWEGKSYEIYEPAILDGSGASSLKDLIEPRSIGQLSESRVEESREEIQLRDLRAYFSSLDRLEESKEDLNLNLINEMKRVEGLAIHYYLEHIKFNSSKERSYARSMLLAKYGNILGYSKVEEILTKVEEFIGSCPEYFSDKWEVFTEYEIGGSRIDRLMVNRDKKEIIILDYKSGRTKEESQLQRYKSLIEEKVGGGYRIRCRFLEV